MTLIQNLFNNDEVARIQQLDQEYMEKKDIGEIVPLRAAWARRERWRERYGRDMGGIQNISPVLFPFCIKGFQKITGEMIDIRGLEEIKKKNLECDDFRLTFAVANKLQRRVKAAAQ